ncbi:hypothetical protein F8M41_009267 [Gigaspora margarita]|uniref:Secreted protein n=1 Tax=Gigaspora margarita TaxID=4874 RepID=A0A8H4EVQ0_GIGMA|nr:hypothetical protein F8M41_009267 [Gigaspora margarita]
MKFPSFYIITILICVYITLAPTFEAYTVDNQLSTGGDLCRIWAEDSNGNRIAGDDGYHECTNDQRSESFSFPDQTYWVHAKVEGSFEEPKVRGPYYADTCFVIYGDVDSWHFDQQECVTALPPPPPGPTALY